LEIRTTDWRASRDLIRRIRTEVFIREQGVPPELEWDEDDARAIHFLAFEGRNPVACARLMSDGRFGRMAVLKDWRRQHWGSRLLNAIEDYARNELQIREIKASAQAHALGFYRKNGFSVQPGFFDDAGIPHVKIYKAPGAPNSNYVLVPGRDETLYHLDSLISMTGWVQVALAANPRSVTLVCKDLNHPLWSRTEVVDAIREFASRSPKRRVKILIPSERGGINRHPLLRLQQRLSSRISLGIHSSVDDNLMITPGWGYMKITGQEMAAGCMNDPGRVRRMESKYSHLLQTANRSREARRLAI